MNLPATKPAAAEITPENFRFLCAAVYEDSGIVLDHSKGYLIEARLAPLARDEAEGTLDGLCNLIRGVNGRSLRAKIVEAMTTNETLFFRDVKPFEALEQHVLPAIVNSGRADRTVRVWSAACSTGQEAYSLAMLWTKMKIAGWRLEIIGTDLSDRVLAKAEKGRYLQLEVNRGLPASYLVRYFEREVAEWVVKPEIRKLVRWHKFNLRDSMSRLGPFDIIFCRNVLIYFDQETKAGILKNLRARLCSGGHLILGASETTMGLDEGYERQRYGTAILYQNPE